MPGTHSSVFSDNSTAGVSDSLWFSSDFLLGAGTVIIQPATGKVVLVSCENQRYWFLPKGRKDVGESLEQTAMREAYEESGYRAQFLPLKIPTRAPNAPSDNHPDPPINSIPFQTPDLHFQGLSTEPIYVATRLYEPTGHGTGGEYITFWYVAYIEEDAICEQNTGMVDEQDYVTGLFSPEEAIKKLEESGNSGEARIVAMAWKLWLRTESAQAT